MTAKFFVCSGRSVRYLYTAITGKWLYFKKKNNANESAVLIKGVRVLKKFPNYELVADRKSKNNYYFRKSKWSIIFLSGKENTECYLKSHLKYKTTAKSLYSLVCEK